LLTTLPALLVLLAVIVVAVALLALLAALRLATVILLRVCHLALSSCARPKATGTQVKRQSKHESVSGLRAETGGRV
jgi:hypothetical protein